MSAREPGQRQVLATADEVSLAFRALVEIYDRLGGEVEPTDVERQVRARAAAGSEMPESLRRIVDSMQETHAQAERGRVESAAFDMRDREARAEMYRRAAEEGRLHPWR